jgi:predicted TPR repeat methyltransferase
MNSIITINTVNDFASSYDDYIQKCNWVGNDILFGLMFEYIQPNRTMLDIGIGTGLSSSLFSTYGMTIYGIDGAQKMLNISANKRIAKEIRQVDLTKDEVWFEFKTFDFAISHGVFHLIGDLKNIVRQTAKILNINGYFGFTYAGLRANDDGFKELTEDGIYEHKNLASGLMEYRHSENYINSLLEVNGFQILKRTEFLAFVDVTTDVKTYFNIIIARRK